ncbi:MAG: plastocyanin/azurin family copper-binding protein [Nitrososphaeraceae archaeon]
MIIVILSVFFIFFISLISLQFSYSENQTHIVSIPKGAANVEVDLTSFKDIDRYSPPEIFIKSGDVVTWTNNDTESHTVTSGIGTGIQGLVSNMRGVKTSAFDSGLFSADSSWSYNFTGKSGPFKYFCTIHPWMEGIVNVESITEDTAKNILEQNNIPTYPVDNKGQKVERFPVHTLTNDNVYDIDLSWSPKTILTNEPITFLIDFFDVATNTKQHLLPYEFILIQNDTVLEKRIDISEVGFDAQTYVLSNPGPIKIKIDNVGNTPSYTEFNTLVYQNPNVMLSNENRTNYEYQPVSSGTSEMTLRLISPMLLVITTYVIIIGLPITVGIIILLYKKGII